MEQRGRKSTDGIVVISPEYRRPEPPAALTEAQAVEWEAIIGRMPAEWFTRETHGLMIQYLDHWSEARELGERIGNFKKKESLRLEDNQDYPMDDKGLNRLLQMRDREVKGMTSIARSMRLTQQSRYNPATANSRAKKVTEKQKPWAK